ncbi:MAG: DEAD/DEAH box helicase family protein, partial [bacterium]
MKDDPEWPLLLSLEQDYLPKITSQRARTTGESPRKAFAQKADIFRKQVVRPEKVITHTESASDALLISLADTGSVDLERILKLTKKTEAEVLQELSGAIFKDPVKGWVTRDEYLSGDVKTKLTQAQEALADDPTLQQNIEALKAVQPQDIEAADIEVRLNSPWLPPKVIQDFVQHLLKGSAQARFEPQLGHWEISIRSADASKNQVQWGVPGVTTGEELLMDLMLNKEIKITERLSDGMGGGKTVVLPEETLAAQSKAEEIQSEFADWIWEEAKRREELVRLYNDRFNRTVDREFDGRFLTMPGKVLDEVISLREHQKNAVWRLIQEGRGLLDHVVGAGKTFTLIAAAMEQKRMGLIRKPIFVVPNHLIEQWSTDFLKLYPGAKVLAAGPKDFAKDRRRQLFSNIATNDWDAVIVAHSSFARIGAPVEEIERFKEEVVNSVTSAMKNTEDKKTIKELEKQQDRILAKLDAQISAQKKDDVVDFLQLGVDSIFIDEAHEFKNLFVLTSMGRSAAGLGDTSGSQKATDLFLKSRIIHRINGGRGVFFATGTPVSNSLAELYTMMRYLDYERMESEGLAHFDAWAGTFALQETKIELDATGQRFAPKHRFRGFINVPELMSRYRAFADVIPLKFLQQRYLETTGKPWPVPRIKTGKPEGVVAPASQEQTRYMESIVQRAEALKSKPLTEKGSDNILVVTMDARKASLDMRLKDPSAPDHPDSKTNLAVKNILEIYRKWDADRGTQLVFIDLSTPAGAVAKERQAYEDLVRRANEGDEGALEKLSKMSLDEISALESGFSVYDDLKAKLVAQGIPEQEVAFIHDANTDARKLDLFAKVNSGKVRVLIGSTPKMGAGMNVQQRLVALHHLDAPWRPSDVEQREGRIIRQGNRLFERDPENFEIRILRYATERSYDSRMWQIIETKARILEQIRNADPSLRNVEDIEGQAASAAELKAA